MSSYAAWNQRKKIVTIIWARYAKYSIASF